MDKNEESAQTNSSKTLLIRHLPAELSQDEKEDLLKYFGAESVRIFSNTGRLVSCALVAHFLNFSWFTVYCEMSHFCFIPNFHRNMQLLQPLEMKSLPQRCVIFL